MSPDEAREMYRSQIMENGEKIDIIRAGTNEPVMSHPVWARIAGFSPQELGGGEQHGDSKVIVLAEDLENVRFDPPLATGGYYKVKRANGDWLNIESADDATRSIAGTLIAYELRVKGPGL